MPFVNAAIDEGVEDELVPEGAYDLTVRSCEVAPSKKNSDRSVIKMMLSIDNAEIPNPAPVPVYLACPIADDEPDTRRSLARNIRRFCHVFGISYEDGGFDTDDAVGATGNCMVIQTEPTDEYPSRHDLRLPRVEDGAEAPGRGAKKAARGRRK